MNNWIHIYFSNLISKKINRDKGLKKQIVEGIDVIGYLIIVNKQKDTLPFIDIVKENGGFATTYSDLLIAFFSEKLYCEEVENVISKCTSYLENNSITYGSAYGELLIGNLNNDIPVIAGIIINEATKDLLKKTNSN